jgi:hypothetical protein
MDNLGFQIVVLCYLAYFSLKLGDIEKLLGAAEEEDEESTEP